MKKKKPGLFTRITILAVTLCVLPWVGIAVRPSAAGPFCLISLDHDQDGDVDGADLQRFTVDLQNGAVSGENLDDFARLFATDDIDSVLTELRPKLALLVASGTNSLQMAWTPGVDGKTPADQVRYDIHLGPDESFVPNASTLAKTVYGVNQAEVTGLDIDRLYFAKVIAVYADSTPCASNTLQTRTQPFAIQEDPNTVVVKAVDLGLGRHNTPDGITYTYNGGTPPPVGSILFSEDVAGGMTLRRVVSVSVAGSEVTVITSDASLTDVLDRASIYNSFQLFDVATEAKAIPVSSKLATAKSMTAKDGSEHASIEWKDRLLMAEQTNFAYNTKDLVVTPQGKSSVIKLIEPKDTLSAFTATVTAEFEPELITSAEWGGTIVKHLDAATVAAKGTLSMTALARYDFASEGEVEKEFQLFKRSWVSVTPGVIPVYQKVTLSMNVSAQATASAKVSADAQANLIETVEVGARYNGTDWVPYITHGEATSLTASLEIAGAAAGSISLVPKIDVEFYTVLNSSLSVEPSVESSLSFAETTNNPDFLRAHPNRLIQLDSFNAELGIESKVEVVLSALGKSWKLLPSTCVLGTGECLYSFDGVDLFSIPELELTNTSSTETSANLQLQITDGISNPYRSGSIRWEVFPDDATITPGSCSKSGEITTCTAVVTPGAEEEYMVFASGTDNLGEVGRQFEDMTLGTTWIVTMTDKYSWILCLGGGGSWQDVYQWQFTGTEEELKMEVGLCEGYTENPYNCNKTGFTCSRDVYTNSIVRIGHTSCSCTAGTDVSSSSFVSTYTWEHAWVPKE